MRTLLKDVGYGIRFFRKNPGVSTAAVLTLALGIGANTAVFSGIESILLSPLPYYKPDRIVRLFEINRGGNAAASEVSIPNFYDWQEQSHSFEQMAVFLSMGPKPRMTIGNTTKRVAQAAVSRHFFEILGVEPLRGRLFAPGEYSDRDRTPVLIISYTLWQRHFGANPELLGTSVRMGRQSRILVGVMPPGFEFPDHTDVWVPVHLSSLQAESLRGERYSGAIARLHSQTTLNEAQTEMSDIARRLELDHPASNRDWEGIFGVLALTLAAIGIYGVMAYSVAQRRQQMGIRAALGATAASIRVMVIRQALTPVTTGLTIGICGAIVLTRVLASQLHEIRSTDPTTFAVVSILFMFVALLASYIPAHRATKVDPIVVLRYE